MKPVLSELSKDIIIFYITSNQNRAAIEGAPFIRENFVKVILRHQVGYHGQFTLPLENPPSELPLLNY